METYVVKFYDHVQAEKNKTIQDDQIRRQSHELSQLQEANKDLKDLVREYMKINGESIKEAQEDGDKSQKARHDGIIEDSK